MEKKARVLVSGLLICAASGHSGLWTSSSLFRNDASGLVYADGIFVLEKSSNANLTSADGMAWTSHTLPEGDGSLSWSQKILSLNGQFFASRINGAWVRSSDGLHWTGVPKPGDSLLRSLAFDDNGYVALVGNASLATSLDGNAWTLQSLDSAGRFYDHIVYGKHTYLLYGNSQIASTADWKTWKTYLLGSSQDRITDIVFAADWFVAIGSHGLAMVSADGADWKRDSLGSTDDLTCILFAENRFVATDSRGAVFTSADGEGWTRRKAGGIDFPRFLAYGDGRFAMANLDGDVSISSDGAASWTASLARKNQLLLGLAYTGSTYIVTGEMGGIFTSPDALTWTERTSGTGQALRTVAYGKDIAVAVGDSGSILTSRDLLHWTARNGKTFDNIVSIAFGDSVFVAQTIGGEILTSADGIGWDSAFAAGAGHLGKIAFGNGTFLAPVNSSPGTLLLSTDGLHWATRQAPSVQRRFGGFAAYGPAGFVFGDYRADDTVYSSRDGSEVEIIALPKFATPRAPTRRITQLAFGAGVYVGCLNTSEGFLVSADGRNWKLDSSAHEASQVLFAGGKWVSLSLALGGDLSSVSGWDPVAAILPRRFRGIRSAVPARGLYLPGAMDAAFGNGPLFNAMGQRRPQTGVYFLRSPPDLR